MNEGIHFDKNKELWPMRFGGWGRGRGINCQEGAITLFTYAYTNITTHPSSSN